MVKKQPSISLQSRRSLGILLEDLDVAATSLVQACRAQNWADVENSVLIIKSYVRSIKEEVPGALAKAQVTQLDQHAQFVSVYLRKRDLKFVLSNAHAIRPDVQRLKSTLGIGGKDDLRDSVEALPPGPERELLEEAKDQLHGLVSLVKQPKHIAGRGDIGYGTHRRESGCQLLPVARTTNPTNSPLWHD